FPAASKLLVASVKPGSRGRGVVHDTYRFRNASRSLTPARKVPLGRTCEVGLDRWIPRTFPCLQNGNRIASNVPRCNGYWIPLDRRDRRTPRALDRYETGTFARRRTAARVKDQQLSLFKIKRTARKIG